MTVERRGVQTSFRRPGFALRAGFAYSGGMGYAFRADDRDLTAAARRIATGELDAALGRLAGVPDAAAVHDLRKRIKKLRGLLRLVRAGFPGAADEIAALRGAAQALATRRDAEVILAWHDRLAPGKGNALRAMLAARAEAAPQDGAGGADHARGVLAGVASRVPDWRVRGRDGRVIAAGLTRSLTRGAAAMQAARGGGAEALHDWRKRVKDLWYQARLMQPVWPEGIAPWRQAADDLGEMLGDHHDLAVFMAMTEGLEGGLAAEAMPLRAQALRLSADIEARAFALGNRLYAAPPEVVCDLWLAWWKGWRRG